MLKYLLLAALIWFVWWAWRQRAKARSAPPRRERPPEAMVACAHCGVLMPESDSVAAEGRHFCSPAHRQLGPRQGR